MNSTHFNKEFFQFIQNSPTPFHAVKCLAEQFKHAGFHKLSETDKWEVKEGQNYFCIRDNGSIIGVKMASDAIMAKSWRMTGAHSDSPALQLKPHSIKTSNGTQQLCVEVYGGPLLSTWFDRDLSIAGRVTVLTGKSQLKTYCINFKRPLAVIPSLAIHLNRTADKANTVEKQKHLYPIICHASSKDLSFETVISDQLKKEYSDISIDKILDFDLFCYDINPPQFIGLDNEFIAAGRLDNLVSCFVSATALINGNNHDNSLILCSNHEEIGSASLAGARGNFLNTVLERLIPNSENRSQSFNNSYFISLDNAHAVHPNFPEKHDPQHLPLLNRGPVIKYNANQRYATTGRSAATYKAIATEVDVYTQSFVMNNDMACGSTIGPIAAMNLGIQTVDIGIPSLAMHSIRELTGAQDPYLLYKTIHHYFSKKTLMQTED